MIALSVSDVTLSFGTDVILRDVTFSVNDGDRVGIIGVNGAGKTSLLRVITGEYTPDSGAVFVQKGHTVGVLEQNPDLTALPGEATCLEYMYGAFPRLIELEGEISRCEAILDEEARLGHHADAVSLTERLTALNTEYASLGGLEYKSRCRVSRI